MKEGLQAGMTHQFKYVVPKSKMVPALYPEAEDFQVMPEVFATGFMVGLLEWACLDAIKPYLDWPNEQTVGTQISVTHQAATPAGFEVTVTVKLTSVEGKKLCFEVEAHDGVDLISKGTHERFVIQREKFLQRLEAKKAATPK